MISLIYGGSSSGKSAFAEKRICELSHKKFYLATMLAFGDEGRKRVEKHRKAREGKGFITLECPKDIGDAFEICGYSEEDYADSALLLECMSNLVANEMFDEKDTHDAGTVVDKVDTGVRALAEKLEDFVIVSNNVFEDGVEYDPSTREYLRALGEVNSKLASYADEVYEVVAGIPIKIK